MPVEASSENATGVEQRYRKGLRGKSPKSDPPTFNSYTGSNEEEKHSTRDNGEEK